MSNSFLLVLEGESAVKAKEEGVEYFFDPYSRGCFAIIKCNEPGGGFFSSPIAWIVSYDDLKEKLSTVSRELVDTELGKGSLSRPNDNEWQQLLSAR